MSSALSPASSSLSRRRLLGALGLGASGLALAACGAPNAESTEEAASPIRKGYSQADVKVPSQYKDRTPILFWAPFTGVNYEVLQDLFTAFNESQDDIVAIAESQGSYADLNKKFTAALQARAVPDIVCFPEMQWLQFYFSDALAPLDGYFDDTWNLNVYLDNYVGEGKAAGKTYLVPFARSTPLFYFNRDRYAQLGLPEEGPSTLDELSEFAPELASVDVDGKPLSAMAFSTAEGWYAQADIWAFGGANSKDFTVTINDEKGLAWLSYLKKFIHEDAFGYMAKDPVADFTAGLTAGTRGSTASLRGITDEAKFDVGCAFMLGQEKAPTQVPTGGSGLMIVRNESQERQDACAELFRFLAEPENSATWHKGTGYVPIVKAAAETDTVKSLVKENPNYQVALDQLVNAHTADRTNWFQANVTDLETGLTEVYGDGKDPASVLETVATKLQDTLDENKSDLEKVLAG